MMKTFLEFLGEAIVADIPTITDYRNHHPTLKVAKEKYEAAMHQMGDHNRWGDARRFQGRASGNRMDEREKLKKAYFRVWDQVTKEYDRKYGTDHFKRENG